MAGKRAPMKEKYGRLTVIAESGRNTWKALTYWCLCECGNHVFVAGIALRRGVAKSCGCLHAEIMRAFANKRGKDSPNFKHGHAGRAGRAASGTYNSRQAMLARCYNEKDVGYPRYGAKGVTVCDRWRDSFANFLADMGERPEGKTLDRKNPFGNYTPENCKWSTRDEQANNKRSDYTFGDEDERPY